MDPVEIIVTSITRQSKTLRHGHRIEKLSSTRPWSGSQQTTAQLAEVKSTYPARRTGPVTCQGRCRTFGRNEAGPIKTSQDPALIRCLSIRTRSPTSRQWERVRPQPSMCPVRDPIVRSHRGGDLNTLCRSSFGFEVKLGLPPVCRWTAMRCHITKFTKTLVLDYGY